MKGFSETWCKWIENFTQGGYVGIKVNDQQGAYFQTRKGLWQGDLLSPLLFNIVADMLALLIARAKDNGQVEGVIPHLVDNGLSILLYAYGTVIFMSHDMEKAINMKFLLCVFEQLSGLKINFQVKSFALVKQRNMNWPIHNYLDVKLVISPSDTWALLCIIGN
jgi:hypothetical protein